MVAIQEKCFLDHASQGMTRQTEDENGYYAQPGSHMTAPTLTKFVIATFRPSSMRDHGEICLHRHLAEQP